VGLLAWIPWGLLLGMSAREDATLRDLLYELGEIKERLPEPPEYDD
jgi:hypothetical protein